jgi:hypothetical protein
VRSVWQKGPINDFSLVWQLPMISNTVAQFPAESTYAEPTVMWRLRNEGDARRAYSVIVPRGSKATAGWFSQAILQESREFGTWRDAIHWLDHKRVTLQSHGWRVDDQTSF